MKRIFKKIILTVLTFCFMIGMVGAETISNSMTMSSYKYSSTPLKFPQTFRVKKTSTDKYAYCTYYSKTPPSGQTFKKGSLITDNGMNYILKQSYNADSNSDFFVYQTALWIYMVDKGIMPGAYNSIKTFKSTVNNSSSSTATKIKNLVSNAKKASANDTSAPTIKIGDTSNTKFTLSNGKYVSDKITVNSSTGDFKVSITSGPSGTTYEKGSNYVKIIIPANKVSSLKTNVKFSVSNSKNVYYAYTYKTSNSSYQTMAVPFKDTKSANASASLNLTTTASATISKQDITTSKELPGASLIVTNSNGKVIDEWVSTTEPHKINNLTEGTYTLKETIAPNGYVLSEETITFKINSSGKLIDENGKETGKIVMYNQPEAKGGVSISKQDITNKEEIAGAHLVIKDYDGKVIDEWVSTTEPHMIEDLKPGIYTLNETIAPEGYILSDETITFTVKEDGSITKVVMYNTPDTKEVVPEEPKPEEPKQEVQVEDTASFKSVTSTLAGIIIIIAGLALVFKNKKNI